MGTLIATAILLYIGIVKGHFAPQDATSVSGFFSTMTQNQFGTATLATGGAAALTTFTSTVESLKIQGWRGALRMLIYLGMVIAGGAIFWFAATSSFPILSTIFMLIGGGLCFCYPLVASTGAPKRLGIIENIFDPIAPLKDPGRRRLTVVRIS